MCSFKGYYLLRNMENASKALLIAGGFLIAMIIASFGVYLYSVYHEHSENMLAAMSEKEISEFNAQFTAFEGRDLTINEVVSILNLVRENNTTKSGNEYKIDIEIISNGILGFALNLTNCINEYDSKEYQKKCYQLVKDYSAIETIKFKKFDGTFEVDADNNIIFGSGYLYVFTCKVNSYNNDTGFINKITITGKTNERYP